MNLNLQLYPNNVNKFCILNEPQHHSNIIHSCIRFITSSNIVYGNNHQSRILYFRYGAVKNKFVVKEKYPFRFYVIELGECTSDSGQIKEIVRYTRGRNRRARKRKAEIEVNRTNGELLDSRFHSTSTRLCNPLSVPPSDYHCDPHPRLPR